MTARSVWQGGAALRGLFWLAALFALAMAALPKPIELPGNPSDKVQHVLAFAVLAGLAAVAYPRVPVPWLIGALSLFGLAIEILQAIPALNRDSDAVDWVADTIACSAVLLVIAVWRGRRR